MVQIILSDEQANLFQSALNAVELRDRHGKLIGYAAPPQSSTVIASARQRLNSAGPWHSTQQVLEHLQSLERR
jgi:hypothetical protein